MTADRLPLPAPPVHPARVAFLGSPEAAVAPLRRLHEAGIEVVQVVTRADARRGRGGRTTPTPVKAAALELGLPVTHDVADLAGAGADLGVVVAFGQILRRDLLAALPMVNLHFSLLPRWRGAAPVERAILAGDDTTGVCLMGVEEGLDTGPVYGRREVQIGPTATAAELTASLSQISADLLVDGLRAGLHEPAPQVGEATYADKVGRADRALTWDLPVAQLHRIVRIGGAWTTFRGRTFKVLAAAPADAATSADRGPSGTIRDDLVACGDGWLRLQTVQPEGKGPMSASDWRNGARPAPDERLGAEEAS